MTTHPAMPAAVSDLRDFQREREQTPMTGEKVPEIAHMTLTDPLPTSPTHPERTDMPRRNRPPRRPRPEQRPRFVTNDRLIADLVKMRSQQPNHPRYERTTP